MFLHLFGSLDFGFRCILLGFLCVVFQLNFNKLSQFQLQFGSFGWSCVSVELIDFLDWCRIRVQFVRLDLFCIVISCTSGSPLYRICYRTVLVHSQFFGCPPSASIARLFFGSIARFYIRRGVWSFLVLQLWVGLALLRAFVKSIWCVVSKHISRGIHPTFAKQGVFVFFWICCALTCDVSFWLHLIWRC